MVQNFFALIRVILLGLSLWEAFLDYLDEGELAKREERRQARKKAIEDSKKAEGDDAIWDSQDRIVDNAPKP